MQVLKAHVIPGFMDRHEAIQLVALAQPDPAVVTTLHGADLLATFFPTLGLNIRTVGTDIEPDFLEIDISVSPGVFHVVDEVLLPADLCNGGVLDGRPRIYRGYLMQFRGSSLQPPAQRTGSNYWIFVFDLLGLPGIFKVCSCPKRHLVVLNICSHYGIDLRTDGAGILGAEVVILDCGECCK